MPAPSLADISAPIVYLNGTFVPLAEAKISVLDRGFLFGDGVYEVIPVYGGHLFRLPEHFARLAQSLAGIRCPAPLSQSEWTAVFQELVARNGGGDLSIYLQITRGTGPNRDHAFPVGIPPSVFAMATPLIPLPAEKRRSGVRAIVIDDIRWGHCDLKTITLLANVMARQQALDVGAYEAILLRAGYITEGAASNVFLVRSGVIITPPKSSLILPGITRDLVLELAAAANLPAREENFTLADLRTANEIWLTSATKEVVPVVQLDDQVIGTGCPGAYYHKMIELYQLFKEKARRGLYI